MVYLVIRSKRGILPFLSVVTELQQSSGQQHTRIPLQSLIFCNSAKMPEFCDLQLLCSRQNCQLLCLPLYQHLHFPSCLQVSWQEIEVLPTGDKMHFEAKKHSPKPPALHPFLLPLDIVTTKTQLKRQMCSLIQLSSFPLQRTEKNANMHSTARGTVSRESINVGAL